MREYELMAVYDLAVAEAGGSEASVQHLTNVIESRGGKVLKVDHWGRRRMAYPINRVIDGDYIVTRLELDPGGVNALEATLRIDEKVFRHLVVRADELPVPPPPREPRQMPGAVVAEAGDVAPTADVAPAGDAALAADVAPAADAAPPETAAPPDAGVQAAVEDLAEESAEAVPEPEAPSQQGPPPAVAEAAEEVVEEVEAAQAAEAPVADVESTPAAETTADTETTPS